MFYAYDQNSVFQVFILWWLYLLCFGPCCMRKYFFPVLLIENTMLGLCQWWRSRYVEGLPGHERVCCSFGKLPWPTPERPSIFSTGHDWLILLLLNIWFSDYRHLLLFFVTRFMLFMLSIHLPIFVILLMYKSFWWCRLKLHLPPRIISEQHLSLQKWTIYYLIIMSVYLS